MTIQQVEEARALVDWVDGNAAELIGKGLDAPSIASRYLASCDHRSSLGHDVVTTMVTGMYFR